MRKNYVRGTANISNHTKLDTKNREDGERRCAYLGYWGSFHLTGATGTAAYAFGKERFLADLLFYKEDENFWYYRPLNGDAFTSLWAFARKKDNCNKYLVWRLDRGGWKRYESTRGWGKGLDDLHGAGPEASLDVIKQLQEQLRTTQDDVVKIDGRLRRLEENAK